jgi:hypothetical protein
MKTELDTGALGQAVWVFIWPGLEIVITPPHAQLHMHELVRAGAPLIITVGEPGDHGAVVTGMHGCGVSTPSAADVAAATCGFDSVVHIPNGMMLTFGAKSWMVAAICPPACTGRPLGTTVSAEGATPKLHISCAVAATCIPMRQP